MAIDLEDEILQDFLIEASEILESLGEQLVELEQSPGDLELLNAIFRGFHTVKGGAGFLSINELVEVCHRAEDVFNVLRQGDRQVTAELMDVILQVVDIVHEMFDQVRNGVEPSPANADLLTALKSYTTPDGEGGVQNLPDDEPEEAEEPFLEDSAVDFAATGDDSAQETEYASAADVVEKEFESLLEEASEDDADSGSSGDEITEKEFDELLDALHGIGGSPTPKQPAVEQENKQVASDEITEEEFDQLLDELHGKGQFSSPNVDASAKPAGPAAEKGDVSDLITDEEFEQVLDALHGKGKFDQTKLKSSDTPAAPKASPEKAPTPPRREPAVAKTEESSAQAGAGGRGETRDVAKSQQTQAETTVRVDTNVLDEIMNMVGELVLVRNRFQTLKANDEAGEQFAKAVSNLDVVTADLQLAVMKTRMQPIKKIFGRFPRVVRDLARSLNKEIRLELVGEETDLDKNLVEALADPLVHLVRNAVDHGIEMPDDRVAAGKAREGVVVLSASQEGDHIQLSIRDDGKGMNADLLRTKVVEKGLMDEETAARLEDKECYNLIFLPGFSTKNEISDVSGRGVGMDVVKTRITQMNGVVEINSSEGAGSTIIIKVPLTLAIMPTLMVKLAEQAFALPLASVLEILDQDLSKTNVVDGQLVVMVRERALPIFFLGEWLVHAPDYIIDKKRMSHVVVVNSGGRQIGFVVDQLIGQEEVVIKPLGAKLHGLEGLAGATITGDGKIALILDVPGLMKRYAG